MATRYAVAFGNTLEPTSRENKKKEVENIDDNIIFLKNSFLNHFKNLKDPRIDRSKEHLLIDIIGILQDQIIGITSYSFISNSNIKQ